MLRSRFKRMGKYMDRKKKLIPLILSSAMVFMWACGEGEIFYADNDDEMMKAKSDPNSKTVISDEEFLQPFITYCTSKEGKKKGCKLEYIEVSSSAQDVLSSVSKSNSSSSAVTSSGTTADSNGSTKTSSSSVKNPSSNSSSNSSSSSAHTPGSSAEKKVFSGKCDLIAPPKIQVGDEVIWRYLPDENTADAADYEWDLNSEVESSIISGSISGTGFPEITVVFKKSGRKYGPTLNFGPLQDLDCENVFVYEVGEGPDVSSASNDGSSSSKVKSSGSVAPSSSSEAVEGHCAVNKSKVYVGEPVELYVAGPDGVPLEGKHNWIDLDGGEFVSGVRNGAGSTKIVVTYSKDGVKEPMVQFGNLLPCDIDNDGNRLLTVLKKETSSSSAEIGDSSSSAAKSSSSKANSGYSSSIDTRIIDF